MLVYHPSFDIYHCAYRILLLISKIDTPIIEIERIRVWDFYFVFPSEARNIMFTQEIYYLKKELTIPENPYEDLIDPKRIFERMRPFQFAAFRYLAAYNLIDSESLTKGIIERTNKNIPSRLLIQLGEITPEQEKIIKLLRSSFNNLPLYGSGGFKYRTRLIDYRYDAV